MAGRVEVAGTFEFSNGAVTFRFGDRTADFSAVKNLEELRAVLVAIAQYGSQASIQAILGGPGGKPSSGPQEPSQSANAYERARKQVEETIARSERSFREHLAQTEEALKRAQDQYEAATGHAASQLGTQPGPAAGGQVSGAGG